MRCRMPSSYFCGCISGFRKSAHVLNEPIGSCYLKYAGIKGRFYYYLVGPRIVHSQSPLERQILKNTRYSNSRRADDEFREGILGNQKYVYKFVLFEYP
jgi:hypothetical protein